MEIFNNKSFIDYKFIYWWVGINLQILVQIHANSKDQRQQLPIKNWFIARRQQRRRVQLSFKQQISQGVFLPQIKRMLALLSQPYLSLILIP